MKVLVAGGNGFLGAHVVRQLVENKNEVISFDINPISEYNADIKHEITFIKGDITDASSILDAVQHYHVNRVVHLASMVTLATQNNPDMAYKLNVGGLLNTLEAARLMKVERLIYASSLAVFSRTEENIPVSEDKSLKPVSLYGGTKVFGEELCKAYHKNYSMDYATIWFPAMWGPGQGQLSGKSPVTGSGKFAEIIEMPE
jgi:UDP-glucose 4-epimerase